MNGDASLLDVLKMEYTQTYSKLLYAEDQSNKYISYIFAFLAAVATLLGVFHVETMNMASVSFVILVSTGMLTVGVLLIMVLYYTLQCYRIGGYIKHLESEINGLLGQEVLSWESKIAPKYIHKSPTAILIFVLVGIVFSFSLIRTVGLSLTIFVSSSLTSIFIILVAVLELVTSIVFLYKLLHAHEDTYNVFSVCQKKQDKHVKMPICAAAEDIHT